MSNLPSTASGPLLSLRGTRGICLINGGNTEPVSSFKPDFSKVCRLSTWSSDGQYFAWANGSEVCVYDVQKGSIIAQLARPKTAGLQFSPKKNYLITWEPYLVTKDNPVNTPNLHIWSLSDGKQSVKCYVQKNHSRWAPEWSTDEKLLARNLNQELQIYETEKMDTISQKLVDAKVSDFSLSPSPQPYYFLCYLPGTKGQPSFAKLFRYPHLTPAGLIASKSFFLGDRVEMKWNKTGTAVLLMTSTDVDTSGASYYGKQALHFLDVKGNSAMIQLPKDGPIYAVEWNPRGDEFCVVYGFMPAKATLYDLKGDPKFDFGTGPRNSAFFNSFGNLLLLCGFGNIRGKIEVWDLKSRRLVTPMEAPDTTYLEWSPDGQYFMTATTAPRLRVGNGFKIWHYSGSLMHEHSVAAPDELWEVRYQPSPLGAHEEFAISSKKVLGIKPSQPQVSKELYRPPGARGTSAILKFLDDREAPSNPRGQPEPAALKGNGAKKEKKRKSKKAVPSNAVVAGQSSARQEVVQSQPNTEVNIHGAKYDTVDKRRKDLRKKLDQIARLKAEQSAGKKLDQNQLEKLKREDEIVNQLTQLTCEDK